jgi:ATP phosphoribosyltransferase
MTATDDTAAVRLALPKGRMQDGVFALLADAGIQVRLSERGYRPTLSLAGFETKILKPQNIVEMLHLGSRDLGFAGADWVAELAGRAGRAARHRASIPWASSPPPARELSSTGACPRPASSSPRSTSA